MFASANNCELRIFPGFAIIGTQKIITTRYHVHRMRVDVAQIIGYRNYWKRNQLIFPQTQTFYDAFKTCPTVPPYNNTR